MGVIDGEAVSTLRLLRAASSIAEGLQPGMKRIGICPECGDETLMVEVSGYNGHLHATCPCGVMLFQ